MELSRIDNSIRNIMFGGINKIVGIIFPFIVRTIFIKTLGEEYLGLNSLFSSVLQVLNLVDLGFASAIVASMYKPIAENDVPKVSALLNLYKKIYRTIGLSILSIGLILTPFIKYFINGTPPQEINIYLLWILYLSNAVVSYLFFAYKVSLLNAVQRNDIVEKISALVRIATSLIQIFVVIMYKSIILYVLLNVISAILYNIFCCLICNKKYPQYVCQGNLVEEEQKTLYKNIGALAIQKIGNTVSLSLDTIIISAFLGLSSVAIYGNYNYVISAISTFVSLSYTAITASIGNSIALETPEKNYQDFKKVVVLNTWLVGWCCICFICIFQDFMIVWMGEEFLFNISIVVTLVIRFYFEQIRKIVLTYKDAAGIWWIDRWRPLIGCIVNLILNIILVKSIGVVGVAISTIVSYSLIELPWETYVLFKYYFKRKEFEYYKIASQVTVKIVLVGFLTYFICKLLPIYGIFAIVVKLCICMILPNLLFVLFNKDNKEFKFVLQLPLLIKINFLKKVRKNVTV